MGLEMRTACECGAGLPAGGAAFICSYECTFCPACTKSMEQVCPNWRRARLASARHLERAGAEQVAEGLVLASLPDRYERVAGWMTSPGCAPVTGSGSRRMAMIVIPSARKAQSASDLPIAGAVIRHPDPLDQGSPRAISSSSTIFGRS